jgi:hypothetical protein
MNAPWPKAKTHRLFQVPERGCSPRQWLGVHPAQTPPLTPWAEQPPQATMQVTGTELRLDVCLMSGEHPAVEAVTGYECTCPAWMDDTLGISRWRRRRTPVRPPRQGHRETSSQKPAHENAGAETDLPGRLLRIPFCDDECRPSVGAAPCRAVDMDRIQQRGVPAKCCREAEEERPGQRREPAWDGKTRYAAGIPAPTAAAQQRAERIAEAGMKADVFERVV